MAIESRDATSIESKSRQTSTHEEDGCHSSLYDSDSDGESHGVSRSVGSHVRQPPVCDQGVGHYIRTSLGELVLGSKMNILLIFAPFAYISQWLTWGDAYTFSFALLALIPFAERVSFVTEDVSKYTNPTVGGLLNASFGNVTELVVCIQALRRGFIRVVQASMLGSVLSNLLLVLGSAFIVGGTRHKEQRFNKVAAITNVGVLMVAVLALSLPSILDATRHGSGGVHEIVKPIRKLISPVLLNTTDHHPEGSASWIVESVPGGDAPLWLSRLISVILLVLYGLLILFQLSTHTHLFEDAEGDDDDEAPILGMWGGIFWLAVITTFISSLSDMIVNTIKGAANGLQVPILFLTGILIPIVGNAAEHAAALIFAWKNKMEICLGSAVGSAVQISVLVIPVCVLLGWALGTPMTLNFHMFETGTLFLACMGCGVILVDGHAHWLKGAILVFSYIIIAAAFWAHEDPKDMS